MLRKPGITDQFIIQMYKNGAPYTEMREVTELSDREIRNVLKKGIM